jgi:hypothetical protein
MATDWVVQTDEYGFPILQMVLAEDAPEPAPVKLYPYKPARVPYPTPEDVREYLGWPPLDSEQTASARHHLSRAKTMVLAFTRGRSGSPYAEWIAPS